MTKKDVIKELNRLYEESGDIEVDHARADCILTKFLLELGYKDIVEAYDKIDKWYA